MTEKELRQRLAKLPDIALTDLYECFGPIVNRSKIIRAVLGTWKESERMRRVVEEELKGWERETKD